MRRDERKERLRTGLVVFVLALVMFGVLLIVGQARGVFSEKTSVYADFMTTSGLREGSKVQLAGVPIGKVSQVSYVDVRYSCDPLTEDVGRYGAGRTDNCDRRLFCAPVAECAELEPMAYDHQYLRCVDDGDCGAQEVCVTTELRRRAPRVLWMGPNGVCARFHTLHHRVRVNMTIEAERLPLIRRDSRASIAANTVLGDQLVNITQGVGDPLSEHDRVLSAPSLAEDIELYRMRLERVIEQVDEALGAVSGLVAELGDQRTMSAISGIIINLEQLSRSIAEQRGLVGALVGDPGYKRDFGMILHALGATSSGVDRFVAGGNRILATTDRNLEPLLADVRATIRSLKALLADLRDPKNQSVVAHLLDDPDGSLVRDLESILGQTEQIAEAVTGLVEAVEGEEGTLGKIVGDPKLANDLGRLLHNLQSNEALKGLLLLAAEQQDVGIKASRNPAGPRQRR
ncbi:MlaD family protein [Paraliomyxa miuraensis]|uniref:MlaD family protein n=1 Tax=Paraliomyxa miuraensis TaxID=376150 RepID=UPI002258FF83|nr:MlaD family protein [Paraliomyxa miuraensis]MCX4242036.1 hypothetical protein [Paraliomyxa miuraensis]